MDHGYSRTVERLEILEAPKGSFDILGLKEILEIFEPPKDLAHSRALEILDSQHGP